MSFTSGRYADSRSASSELHQKEPSCSSELPQQDEFADLFCESQHPYRACTSSYQQFIVPPPIVPPVFHVEEIPQNLVFHTSIQLGSLEKPEGVLHPAVIEAVKFSSPKSCSHRIANLILGRTGEANSSKCSSEKVPIGVQNV